MKLKSFCMTKKNIILTKQQTIEEKISIPVIHLIESSNYKKLKKTKIRKKVIELQMEYRIKQRVLKVSRQ